MSQNDNNRKGKPINSSVPSFRFNATAEEIEELYATDEDHDELSIDVPSKAASDIESSPNKSSKFGKRSTSVDVSTVDLSPPSDPWRFFSDIKGKITKSVEGKITEYKTRTTEGEGASPKRNSKGTREGIKEAKECREVNSKDTKESSGAKESKEGSKEKDCSSLSDSEELSESSISRTCGIVSTTEGVEMSSDDEGTTSLSDKKEDKDSNGSGVKCTQKQSNKQKRTVTIVGKDGKKETKTTTAGFLEDLQNINMGIEIDNSDVESGVDVLAQIDNVDVDVDQINITQITGEDIRTGYFGNNAAEESTIFSPTGFVDLRPPPEVETTWQYILRNRTYCFLFISLIVYLFLPMSSYMSGFITGNILMFTVAYLYLKANELGTPYHSEVNNNNHKDSEKRQSPDLKMEEFVEIQPIKEERPALKYQGWVNEYPEVYDPYTYHISQTQSVYLRLQANLLKISNTRSKIPKRASYNESEHKMSFTRHRIYNLLGAEILLLPLGLTKIRHWSKKYPICIILSKDQLCYDNIEKDKKSTPETDLSKEVASSKGSSTITSDSSGTQIFSKLIEESAADNDDNFLFDLEDEVPAPVTTFADEISMQNDEDLVEDEVSFFDTQETIDPQMDLAFLHDPIDQTCIYIFARTDREKEHWYRRFKRSTHRMGQSDGSDSVSDIVKDDAHYYSKYLKVMSPILTPIESGGTYSMFMSYYSNASSMRNSDSSVRGRPSRQSMEIEDSSPTSPNLDFQWLNTLIYRMVFDFHQSEHVIKLIQDRIARKLAAIKLPIFIESLRMTELTFGNFAPKICKIGKPYLDDWGLWLDFDLSYEGSVIIMVLTKLNLLKLKQQGESHRNGTESPIAFGSGSTTKSAIYHSDVEDTAESSSDDERPRSAAQTPLDDPEFPAAGRGAASKQNKKFMTMVDRFAESKFFQRATENKYIKKAIEGVSNTDVGLKLELKALKGCLVVNIPPPPSDRIWFGFRSAPMPKLQLTAHPVVGEKNWNFNKVSSWIEKRVYKEFLKVLLLPNMEDIVVPGMDSRLAE